ncbi:MAG: hypothetical protein PWR11_913 [Bacillota bacterium]|jgi:cellulose synthase/poly-beta-1,6-N-acetylglucosamine synthase-like glycosyltransferase|nr:hypothetical protein [Bacillota bacterium]MDK2785047.1 hypothetical protein [Bacillota bacterium]
MLWAGRDVAGYIIALLAIYGCLSLMETFRHSLGRKARKREGKPFVSILVIARDDEERIEGVIRWLLGLNYLDAEGRPNFELVVVSAGSKDQTPAIIERLAREAPILTAITLAKTEGAYEQGIALCRGEVICLMDLAKQPLHQVGRAITRIFT